MSDSAGLLPLQGERIYELNKCSKNDASFLRVPGGAQCFLQPEAEASEADPALAFSTREAGGQQKYLHVLPMKVHDLAL
jgi:hypothetical protein